jgi:SAM-dependent methyltransferase
LARSQAAPRRATAKVVIGVFGSYELRKGQDLAVNGMLELPQKLRGQAELRLFGRSLASEPNFRADLEQITDGDGSIILCGELDHYECLNEMAACDAILVPSRDDALSFVALDALCLGKALLSSETTGVSEYLEDGRSALILHENTPDEIGRVLARVIADPELRASLGRGAREVYERNFSARSFAEKLHAALGLEPPALTTAVSSEINRAQVNVIVTRDNLQILLCPEELETFEFHDQDRLTVVPEEEVSKLPQTYGDIIVGLGGGKSIRVPPFYAVYEFRGYRIPIHLISLTGGGPEMLEATGIRFVENYRRHVGLTPEMTVVEIGCGIGRLAFQLTDILDQGGRYVGIDVTRESIIWCQHNITMRHPNFTFHHFDAFNEMYNPFGQRTTNDFVLPIAEGTADRIFLASVFTHLLEEEVTHYMREFARVLKPNGLVYASFFLHSAETIASAALVKRVSWDTSFSHPIGDGVYVTDPVERRAAVAFTDAAMRRMIAEAGLELDRPYLKGWWSGLHADADDGQDVAILRLPHSPAEPPAN